LTTNSYSCPDCKEVRQQLKEVRETQLEFREMFAKQRGFIGGVVFIVSCITAAIGIFVKYVTNG